MGVFNIVPHPLEFFNSTTFPTPHILLSLHYFSYICKIVLSISSGNFSAFISSNVASLSFSSPPSDFNYIYIYVIELYISKFFWFYSPCFLITFIFSNALAFYAAFWTIYLALSFSLLILSLVVFWLTCSFTLKCQWLHISILRVLYSFFKHG